MQNSIATDFEITFSPTCQSVVDHKGVSFWYSLKTSSAAKITIVKLIFIHLMLDQSSWKIKSVNFPVISGTSS